MRYHRGPLAAVASVAAAVTIPAAGRGQEAECPHERIELSRRSSPLASVNFALAGGTVQVCYGRPSARGRTMIGGEAVPYGRLWRTGANETTKIRTPIPLSIAGIEVPPGTYALYTVPGEEEWEVIVNRSWRQWGHESTYTDEVRAQEAGRARVPAGTTDGHVETFTIRAEPRAPEGVDLVLEWERTRIRIPVAAAGG